MIKFIKNIFKDSKSEEQDDFADFFLYASSREKKKVFKRVIRKSNQDQKKYLDRYKKMHSN